MSQDQGEPFIIVMRRDDDNVRIQFDPGVMEGVTTEWLGEALGGIICGLAKIIQRGSDLPENDAEQIEAEILECCTSKVRRGLSKGEGLRPKGDIP